MNHPLAAVHGRGCRPRSTPTDRSPQDPGSGVKTINHNKLQHRTTLNNKKRGDLQAAQIASECSVLLLNTGVC